jgi:hypothetical protein
MLRSRLAQWLIEVAPPTHDIRCPTYRARAATHVQPETSAIPAARCEHRASPLLAVSWTGGMDPPTIFARGALSPLKCNWRRAAGDVTGYRWAQRAERIGPVGTSSTEQAAASGWLCGDTPSERGPGTSSGRMKRLRSPGRLRIEQPFGVRHAGPATVSEQLCVPKARAILASFSGAPRRPASSPIRP